MSDARNQFLTPAAAREFILSGAAVFTIVSEKSGGRYTFKVQDGKKNDGYPQAWFVKLAIGPDNNRNYTYLGIIKHGKFGLTRNSRSTQQSLPYKAFEYMWLRLTEGIMPQHMQIWHEGRCGRCGKRLTDPTSIERGYGPECQEILDRTHLQAP